MLQDYTQVPPRGSQCTYTPRIRERELTMVNKCTKNYFFFYLRLKTLTRHPLSGNEMIEYCYCKTRPLKILSVSSRDAPEHESAGGGGSSSTTQWAGFNLKRASSQLVQNSASESESSQAWISATGPPVPRTRQELWSWRRFIVHPEDFIDSPSGWKPECLYRQRKGSPVVLRHQHIASWSTTCIS